MRFNDFKVVFASVFLVLVLLCASPALSMMISLPGGERFTELYVLGPGHLAENYPFEVKAGELYNVYLGVTNHMGDLEYYVVYVKFRNWLEPTPDINKSIPSPLPPVYEYRFLLGDGETAEENVTFSFSGVHFQGIMGWNASCTISYLNVGGLQFLVNKTAPWNTERSGYYFQLFFELWRHDEANGSLQFHDRYVGFWLGFPRGR
jgi:uncharacterized membrane protein